MSLVLADIVLPDSLFKWLVIILELCLLCFIQTIMFLKLNTFDAINYKVIIVNSVIVAIYYQLRTPNFF